MPTGEQGRGKARADEKQTPSLELSMDRALLHPVIKQIETWLCGFAVDLRPIREADAV
jgi:hypothetical protein